MKGIPAANPAAALHRRPNEPNEKEIPYRALGAMAVTPCCGPCALPLEKFHVQEGRSLPWHFIALSPPLTSQRGTLVEGISRGLIYWHWPAHIPCIAPAISAQVGRRFSVDAVKVNSSGSPLRGRRLARVKAYIESNLSKSLSLDHLAGIASLSSFHFSRTFKCATGLSPHRYLTQRRMELAKSLLSTHALPVAHVARAVGIPNHSHFTTLFIKVVGCAPKDFRGNPGLGNVAPKPATASANLDLQVSTETYS
jgi:AraC-like DNA-binding protein